MAIAKPISRFLPAGMRSMDKAAHAPGASGGPLADRDTMATFSTRKSVIGDPVGPLHRGWFRRLFAKRSTGFLSVMATE